MIRIEGRGAVYGEVWYDEKPHDDPGVDIVLYRQTDAPIAGARDTTAFLSLVADLSAPESAIAANFDTHCRYATRRAETKDGLHMEFIIDPESRLDEFRTFYDAFAREKSLPPSSHRWLVAACKARQLVLTSASKNGEALVWHAYLIAGRTARLEHSSSHFRNRENDYRALVGRANRWLHWKDMLSFKEMGIERYDWGGLFEDDSAPERAGINNFKKSFGGQPQHRYDCTVPMTVRGRIWLPLRGAWQAGTRPAGILRRLSAR